MENDNVAALDFLRRYGAEIEELSAYIPYFEKMGNKVASEYDGSLGESSLKFAVYDSTLLNFVKKARQMRLMYKNYPYVYTRNRITTHKQEKDMIEKATLKDVDVLRAFLSRYVIEGQRKGFMWQEGVGSGIFALVIRKLQEIMQFYGGNKK